MRLNEFGRRSESHSASPSQICFALHRVRTCKAIIVSGFQKLNCTVLFPCKNNILSTCPYLCLDASDIILAVMVVNSSPLDKMAAILADDIFKWSFFNENVRIPIHISLNFIPRRPIYYTPVLVQVMAWRRTGDKPLSEPMMTQFIDACMRH